MFVTFLERNVNEINKLLPKASDTMYKNTFGVCQKIRFLTF